jgi:hypothetical protein
MLEGWEVPLFAGGFLCRRLTVRRWGCSLGRQLRRGFRGCRFGRVKRGSYRLIKRGRVVSVVGPHRGVRDRKIWSVMLVYGD